MFLTDKDIHNLCGGDGEKDVEKWLLHPFTPKKKSVAVAGAGLIKCPSYGLSHCGYDITLRNGFDVADHNRTELLDILDEFDKSHFIHVDDTSVVIPPHGFVIAVSNEYFNIPEDIIAFPMCKSTYVRRGITLPPTVIEPGWRGELVLEIINSNPYPVRIHSGIGIAQVVFAKLTGECRNSYRGGKYDKQRGITHAHY